MAKLVHSDLESNPHNEAGTALALYFEGEPTKQEVTDAAVSVKGQYAVGLYEDEAAFETHPTFVSDRAGLVRVLVFNVG